MKKGTFVKLSYTGKLDNGQIFDTTDPQVAKTMGQSAKPIIICLGQGQLLPGLDEKIIGKDLGDHSVTLEPKEAFGEKSTKKLELVPKNQLQKQGINPKPGMELNIDGDRGVVRNISGGRVIVDFNHPLAGQKVHYDIKLIEEVQDTRAQVQSIIDVINLPYESVDLKDDAVTIKVPQIYPQQMMDALQQKITELTSVKTVSFEQGTQQNKK